MYNNLLNYCFPSSISSDLSTTNINSSYDTCIKIECEKFLPEVYDTWLYIHKLSTDTTHFREIYDLYKYERSEIEQKSYFNQLKILDDTIYKLSLTIHQHLQYLEKFVQPIIEQYQHKQQIDNNNYIPAYIRILQNQLNSLKLSFQRIIIKHNSNSIDYQNNLKQSIENSKEIISSYKTISSTTRNKITNFLNTNNEENQNQQIQINEEQDLTEQEKQINDLKIRLESLRILNDRIRQMNEMTMALYLSVQEQNELTDNIWLNTSAGSDYIAQSVDEFRLVKNLKQSKMNLYIKLISIIFCFLLILVIILTLILILN